MYIYIYRYNIYYYIICICKVLYNIYIIYAWVCFLIPHFHFIERLSGVRLTPSFPKCITGKKGTIQYVVE